LAVQGDTTLCEGQSVVLGTTTPEAGITYTWTPDDGSLDNANAANPLATPTTSTVYTLTASNPGCTETRTLTVAVVPIALDLNVPDSVMLCKGEVLNIQAFPNPPSTVVNWSPFTSLIIGSNGQNVTATPEETITYTASVTVAGGCSLSRTVRVQVDSLPANLDILPSDTTICLGEKVLLVSPIYEPAEYMNIEFLWIPGEGQLTPDTLYNLVAQPTDTIVYQRISISGACIDTAQATVNVIVPPDMKLSPADTSVCVGQSVVLSLSNFEGVENIMWTPASTLSCSMDCVTSVATPTGSTTYSVNGTYEMCPVSASAVVNVTLPPPYQFPDDVQLCGGDSIRLNLISDPTATYLWTSLPPGFTSNEPQPTVAPAQTTTYILQATNGCSTQAQLTVTVSNATLQVSNDTTICEGFSTLLTAAGTLPGNYTWSDGQTGQAVVVTPAQTSTYTVTYTFGQDCQLTDEVVVTIQGQSAQVTFPTDVELCPGESVVLNSTATPGATYTWASTPPGFTSNQAIPPAITPSVTTTYNVTATLGNCVRTQSVTITVYNATLSVSADTTLCAGGSVTLSANGSVTGDYLWTPGGTQPSFLVTPAQTTTYDLLYTYGDNCTIEESVQVTVVPNFMVNIVADPDTNRINAGASIALDAVLVPSQSTNGFQFQWFENGTTSIGSGQQITATPATTDSTIFYLVQVTSPFGCEQEAVIDFVVVQPKVRIPNAFTPNGDQDNSTFGIVVLEGIAVVERLEIYNRWGQKIFESTDPNARWDGNIDGKPAPVDVYVYNVRWRRGDGALELAHGEVTLLR
jgi:gliding motility-associated-like protein